ncbi:hypothetical protein V8F06_003459 [Rhypophila decipiens]
MTMGQSLLVPLQHSCVYYFGADLVFFIFFSHSHPSFLLYLQSFEALSDLKEKAHRARRYEFHEQAFLLFYLYIPIQLFLLVLPLWVSSGVIDSVPLLTEPTALFMSLVLLVYIQTVYSAKLYKSIMGIRGNDRNAREVCICT